MRGTTGTWSSVLVTTTLLLLTSVVVDVPGGVAAESTPLLFMTESEKELELAVKAYVDAKKPWKVSVQVNNSNPDDFWLVYNFTFAISKIPDLKMVVDTQASARRDGKPSQRVIKIIGFVSGVRYASNNPRRVEMLEFFNEWAIQHWFAQAYLDKDGDIRVQWSINIPGADVPVHAGQVLDAMDRLYSTWVELGTALKAKGLLGEQGTSVR